MFPIEVYKWFCLILIAVMCPIMGLGQDNAFTGYSTVRIENGQADFKSFGFKDRERNKRYDSLTLQPVGSVSKLIIGLALVKAREMGIVEIDENIEKYLDFKISIPYAKNNAPITLRHLATHTSGILDNEKFYIQSYSKGLKPTESLEDFIKSYLSEGGHRYSGKNFGKYKPGEAYAYSNIGAALAAYVLQCASRTSFDRFTEDHIFKPLGMNDSHWFYDEKRLDRYSELFDEKDKPLGFYTLSTYPDGALKTNAVDLTRLLQTMILGYQGKSDFFKDPKSWELFFAKNFTDTNPIAGVNPREPNTGIFVIYAKSGAIGHTGSDPGVSSFVFFDPQTGIGKIFMANEDLTADNLEAFKEVWEGLNGNTQHAAENP